MGIRALVLFLLPLLTFAADDTLDKAASDAVNSFSLDFLKEILKKYDGNVAMSPASVSTLLAILHQGAAGNTKTQLTQTLKAEPEQTLDAYRKITKSLKNVSNETILEFANGIFLNKGFEVLPKFKQTLQEDFLTEIATANFAQNVEAAEQINKWVSEYTHGKIKDLIDPNILTSFTRLVLVNAIYFKDTWLNPFDPESTRKDTFYADSEKKVPMMHQRDYFKTGHMEGLQAQWLELPFEGERFSMVIVLPKEKNGLEDTLKQLTSEHISKLLSNVKQGREERVILSMPKFEIDSTLKLIPILERTVPDLFTAAANLSGVSGEGLTVSEAIQKAKMEVDEFGATAAAATAFIAVAESFVVDPRPDVVFNVDHPFLMFIVDKVYGVILFVGRVADP